MFPQETDAPATEGVVPDDPIETSETHGRTDGPRPDDPGVYREAVT